MILQVIFWILLVLYAIGYFVPPSPIVTRSHGIVLAILIAILGYRVFGSPLEH